MEIWRDILGFEGRYQVSSWGRVRNAKGQLLKFYKNEKGYLKVDLCKDNVKSKCRINRLVAEAFIPNPYNLPQVNHKDGNKENNSFTNLEWIDNYRNQKHADMLRKGIIMIVT